MAVVAAELAGVVTTQAAATPGLCGTRSLPSAQPPVARATLGSRNRGRLASWLRRATAARYTEERAPPDLKAEAAARREERLKRFVAQSASFAKEEASELRAAGQQQPGGRLQRWDSLQDAASRIHGAPLRCSLRDSQSSEP